jgi:hypothetical protein
MPDAKPQEREPAKGPEAYLSPDERKALQRSLSFPEDLPPKFKSWLIDFIAVNVPQIPVSQIVGFQKFEKGLVTVTAATEIVTSESVSGTTYVDAATVGPSLSGLLAGTYVLLWGAQIHTISDAAGVGRMSLSINGAAASDTDAVLAGAGTTVNVTPSRGKVSTVAGLTNTVVAKYSVFGGGTVEFAKRWLIALKIGS